MPLLPSLIIICMKNIIMGPGKARTPDPGDQPTSMDFIGPYNIIQYKYIKITVRIYLNSISPIASI
jgi:hypothetical protein